MSKVCFEAHEIKIVPRNPCSNMKIPSKVWNPFQCVPHTSIDISVGQFFGNKGIVEFFDLGSKGLWQQPGIDLFGDVG